MVLSSLKSCNNTDSTVLRVAADNAQASCGGASGHQSVRSLRIALSNRAAI